MAEEISEVYSNSKKRPDKRQYLRVHESQNHPSIPSDRGMIILPDEIAITSAFSDIFRVFQTCVDFPSRIVYNNNIIQ